MLSHSGVLAVTIAGVVVGNTRTPVERDLREFKDQLTVMLIGLLFVLLAADVRFEQVRALVELAARLAELGPLRLIGPQRLAQALTPPRLEEGRMVADVLAESRTRIDAAGPQSAADVRGAGRAVRGAPARRVYDHAAGDEELFAVL